MTAATDPPSTSNRSKAHATSPHIVFKPTPMSRMTQSAELDEYTASMRNFLASVEDRANHVGTDRDNRSGSESEASTSRGSSGRSISGSERSKSPEFRWMDLDSVRREHGGVNLNCGEGGGNENRISKAPNKTSPPHHHHHHHHHHSHRHGTTGGRDSRQHHTYQRNPRSTSPGGKALLSKKHTAQAVGRSAEKH